MKKKRIVKTCIIIIGVWIAFTVGKGFYWYYRLDGENILLIFSTQYSPTPVDIKVYINDKLIFEDTNYLSFCQYRRVHIPFGIYKLKAIIDNKEYTRSFILFPIKYVYIEMLKDQEWNDTSEEAKVTIDVSSSPINMM